MISEQVMKWCGRKWPWPIFRHCPSSQHMCGGLRETKNLARKLVSGLSFGFETCQIWSRNATHLISVHILWQCDNWNVEPHVQLFSWSLSWLLRLVVCHVSGRTRVQRAHWQLPIPVHLEDECDMWTIHKECVCQWRAVCTEQRAD